MRKFTRPLARGVVTTLLGLAIASCAATDLEVGAHAETPGPGSPSGLAGAAAGLIGFLRGEIPFERIRLADTVLLRLAPAGGGMRVAYAREDLTDRARWVIPGDGHAGYSLVPPSHVTDMTLRVGAHLNCFERDLASVAPDLATLPHVGVRLAPPVIESCLQTWNLTLVFERDAEPPVLVAAVYDQWEW